SMAKATSWPVPHYSKSMMEMIVSCSITDLQAPLSLIVRGAWLQSLAISSRRYCSFHPAQSGSQLRGDNPTSFPYQFRASERAPSANDEPQDPRQGPQR